MRKPSRVWSCRLLLVILTALSLLHTVCLGETGVVQENKGWVIDGHRLILKGFCRDDMLLTLPVSENVACVSADDTSITNKGLHLIVQKCPNIKKMWLTKTQVSDDIIDDLKTLSSLQILDVRKTKISHAFLARLNQIPQVVSLGIGGAWINDQSLKLIENPLIVTYLDCEQSSVTDAGLVFIGRMKELKVLSLRNTQITDTGIKSLEGLNQLDSLELNNTNITDESMKIISQFGTLEALMARNTCLTDVGLQYLASGKQLSNLSILDLSGTQVTTDCLVFLKSFTKLKAIALSNTQVNGVGLKQLLDLPCLEYLVLCNTNIGDEDIHLLAKIHSLERVELTDTKVTDKGISHLKSMKPSLNIIYLK